MTTSFDEMKAALERAEKIIADQHKTIVRMETHLGALTYHFNSAVAHLEKVAEELRKWPRISRDRE